MSARADYQEDFFAWTQEQAQILRSRGTLGLDWDNLAEEIDSMGRRDRRELESRLRLILHHLLKWQAQPGLRGRGWQSTLRGSAAKPQNCSRKARASGRN